MIPVEGMNCVIELFISTGSTNSHLTAFNKITEFMQSITLAIVMPPRNDFIFKNIKTDTMLT